MPPLETIITVCVAGLALSVTPGPSMLYILSRTLGQGRAAGLASALGLATGGIILAVATALGLAAIFAQFEWLVEVLHYLGSAYLIWLGVDMIRSASANPQEVLQEVQHARKPFYEIVWQGVLVEVLNPQTVLFFALFLPPFVHTSGDIGTHGSVQSQLLILGALIPLTAIPADILVAYMGGSMTKVLNSQRNFRKYLAWLGGFVLILIALT